jgi:acyl-CoA synthetase (AMP-forming)/AMP-acid ligase II
VATRWSKGRRFINMYGSSEVAMGSTLFDWHDGATVTLGTPFPNTQMYVLDEELEPVPVGVVGEICTAGKTLANGYLHRSDSTAEKFIPNPFAGNLSDRIYRTGDLGRYLPSGDIQYAGRRDFQVSVRGFRVEVMEIERALLAQEGIAAAAVSVRPDPFGRDRLVGYVVPGSGHAQDRAALRKSLARTLPDYMIPSLFVALDALPLTPNRKLDRLRLPEPDVAAQLEDGYEAPVGTTEQSLAEIWARVLRVERVGRAHGFFHIGGHSLLAAMVLTEVRERFGANLPLRVLIENDTIRAFAAEIDRAKS